MLISQFVGYRVSGCYVARVPWPDLVAAFASSREQAKKFDGTLWSPSTWHSPGSRGTPAEPGTYIPERTKENVLALNAVVVDFDDVTPQVIADAVAVVQRLGLAAVLHSTWSHMHTEEGKGIRLRLVLPLEAPVHVSAWASTWAQITTLFRGCDPSCKDECRGYYPPTHRPGATPLYWAFEGRPLRLADLPPADRDSFGARPADAPPAVTLTPEILRAWAGRLAGSSSAREMVLSRPVSDLAAGAAYAKRSERHDVTRAITLAMASRWPGLVPEGAATLFEASLSQPGMEGFELTEVVNLLKGALRILDDRKIAAADMVAYELASSCRRAWAGIDDGREAPYLPDELDEIAKRHVTGLQGESSTEILSRAWILLDGKAAHVLGPMGYLSFRENQLQAAPRTYLAPAVTAEVRLHKTTKEGHRVLRPWGELVGEYSSVVERVDYRYDVPDAKGAPPFGGVYDARTRVLSSSAGKLRPLAPQFDPEIHEWLRHLAQTPAQLEALCLWLSYVVDVDQPCSALFLIGPRGSGKSLFHDGLAYLWDGGMAEAVKAMQKHNECLLRTPYVVAEEKLPKSEGARGAFDMEAFRALISTRQHSMEPKGLAVVTIHGAIRFVASLQRTELIELQGDLTAADFAAISERITMIHTAPTTMADAFPHLTKRQIDGWAQGGIARHALALRQRRLDREAATGQSMAQGRFLVSLDSAADQRALAARSGISDVLVEWLGRALVGQPQAEPGLQVVRCPESPNGFAIACNAAFVWARWANASKEPAPRTGRISRGLAALSVGEVRPRIGAARPRMQLIDGALVARWIEDAGIAEDGTAALQALAVDIE